MVQLFGVVSRWRVRHRNPYTFRSPAFEQPKPSLFFLASFTRIHHEKRYSSGLSSFTPPFYFVLEMVIKVILSSYEHSGSDIYADWYLSVLEHAGDVMILNKDPNRL